MKTEDILDAAEPNQRIITFKRILYLWIVLWILVNVLLGLEYYVAASGMLITTGNCPPDMPCPPPHTPFMDDCWKCLLMTNLIGILGAYFLRKRINS